MDLILRLKSTIASGAKFYEDAQIQVSLLAVVMATFAGILLFYYMRETPSLNRLPPGRLGLPLIGETMQCLWALKSDKPQKFFDDRIRKYGPVFKTSLFGHPTVVLAGPAGNRLLFSNENKLVVVSWPNSVLKLLGIDCLINKFGDEHRRLRSALHKFFGPEALQNHIGKASSIMQSHLEQDWKGKQEVTLLPSVRKVLFAVACSVFFSLEDKHMEDELSELLETVIVGTLSLPLDLPGTRFRKAIEARAKLDTILSSMIEKRRHDLRVGKATCDQDLLSFLLTVKDENGNQLTERQILNNVSVILHGGHHSTVSPLTIMFKLLSLHKASYEALYKEQLQIISSKKEGEDVTWNDLKKMKYTWQAAQETMRLFPPILGTFRRAITDIEYNGYIIPKGWKLMWTVYSTHTKEEYFDEPHKFKPPRFNEETKAVAPYTFLPFGSGPRICPGSEYSKLEILLFFYHFVKSFSGFVVIDPEEKISSDPVPPYPVNGLPVKLFPRS